jgi:hypothetical protein
VDVFLWSSAGMKQETACRECRKRHIKCSRGLPSCSQCIEKGLRCVPSPPVLPQKDRPMTKKAIARLSRDLVKLLNEMGISPTDW